MLGQVVPRTWAAALHAASGGQPLAVIELVTSIANEREPFAIDWSARSGAAIVDHRARQVQALAAGPRRALAIIAALGGRARIERVLGVLPGVEQAHPGSQLRGDIDNLLAVLEESLRQRPAGSIAALDRPDPLWPSLRIGPHR